MLLFVVTACVVYAVGPPVAGFMCGLGRRSRFALFVSGHIEDLRCTVIEGRRGGGRSSQSAPEIMTWLIGVAVLGLLYVPYGLGRLLEMASNPGTCSMSTSRRRRLVSCLLHARNGVDTL